MQASIYQGTKYEISWSLNDAVDPHLVERIREAGNEQSINWSSSPFAEGLELLCDRWSKAEIIERLYDEDPEIIELMGLLIQFSEEHISKEFKILVRLYLPVFIVILDYLDC